jgi:hypothetical protein
MADPIPMKKSEPSDEAAKPEESKPAPTDERMKKASEAFARFQSIQVNPKATVATKQIITSCIVRRPRKNEFIRVFAEVEPWTGLVFEDKDEDAFFLVKEEALQHFYDSPPFKMLVLTINQNGAFFLWPVPVDDRNTWNDSSRKAYQLAKTQWVKLVGDRGEGLYKTYLAEGELPPPRWPDKDYWELLDLAFPNSKVVSDADHDVVRKIRTGQSRQ